MLIEMREVIRKNWALCGGVAELVGLAKGKDRGTEWLVALNEARKIWAHPLKQRHSPLEPVRLADIRALHGRVVKYLKVPNVGHGA